MAKKNTTKSKIKNNNIDKEKLTRALHEEKLEDLKNIDEEIKLNLDELHEQEAKETKVNPSKQETKVETPTAPTPTEAPQVNPAANSEAPSEVDELKKLQEENLAFKKEVIRLQTLCNNLQEENNKLKSGMEANQQQLINKLKEKQSEAKEQLEARLEQLEKDKANEIQERRDSIYVDVVLQFLQPFLLFEKTVAAPIENEVVRNYVQGYNMVCNMFKDTFNNLGIEQIVVNVGDEFNHNFMEAFDTESNPNFKPNQVTKVVDKGFVYKGKVIKYTTVVVNK